MIRKLSISYHPFFKQNNLTMGITNVITGTVKDAVALSQNIAKVVKEEIELYLDSSNNDESDYEGTAAEYANSVKQYIEDFEDKAKELIQNTFAGFKSSKTEEQEELEARISALEEKLSKLVEDSLEALRQEDADRI